MTDRTHASGPVQQREELSGESRYAASPRQQLLEERRVTIWGMVCNLGLTAGKIAVGLSARSSAIIADGLHSASDLASDVAVLWGIHAAKRPADACHLYGHFRYEAIAALFVGLLLIIAASVLGIESLMTISQQHGAIRSWWPFWAAVVSIALKEALYWWTRAVGRRFGNQALVANAWHHRSDAFSSVVAAVGISVAIVGGPRWAFLDHVTAVVLAAFLVVIGIRICRDALHQLTDRAPDPATLKQLRDIVSQMAGVRGLHAFRARQTGAGGGIEMDVHVQVDPNLSVRQGHEIASRIEQQLRTVFNVSSAVVHVEPMEESGSGDNQEP